MIDAITDYVVKILSTFRVKTGIIKTLECSFFLVLAIGGSVFTVIAVSSSLVC